MRSSFLGTSCVSTSPHTLRANWCNASDVLTAWSIQKRMLRLSCFKEKKKHRQCKMEDLDEYFDMFTRYNASSGDDDTVTAKVADNENVAESDGRLWDRDTGAMVGTCFVSAYRPQARRTFSRYSRRARFMTHLFTYFENPGDHAEIMNVFDQILHSWKSTRNTIPRLYFLNVRVLLFLICDRLKLPPPFTKRSCLRDLNRFHAQQTIFNNLCVCK